MPAVIRANGQTFGLTDATVAALDHGFLYGNGLFETTRATHGKPFALDKHLQRMQRAGQMIGLPVPPAEILVEEIAAALRDADEQDAYVRLTVSRGAGAPGPDPNSCADPTIVVIVKPFPAPPERWLRNGVCAVTSPIRRNVSSPLTRVKSLNYMECILAKQAAKQQGADEAIFLDTEGYLAEATAWNVFFVENERLHTPSTAGPLLPGITREIVLRLAKELGVSYATGTYSRDRLVGADEAFLTNSLYGVIPLGQFDGQRVGEQAPGPITKRLAERYEAERCEACSP